ncbi:MAG: hypothetical protein H0V92_09970 [Pseudonocardiales bacterium]|nr:hypothetical protein [Pseudonocardiales bacterium]
MVPSFLVLASLEEGTDTFAAEVLGDGEHELAGGLATQRVTAVELEQLGVVPRPTRGHGSAETSDWATAYDIDIVQLRTAGR